MSTTDGDVTPATEANRLYQRARYWDLKNQRAADAPPWMAEVTSGRAIAAYLGEHYGEGNLVNPSDVSHGCQHPGATPTTVTERFRQWYRSGYLMPDTQRRRLDEQTRRWKRYGLITAEGDRHFTAEALAMRYIATRYEQEN